MVVSRNRDVSKNSPMRHARNKIAAATAVALLTALSAAPSAANDDSAPEIARCMEAVGTYLTRRENRAVEGPERVGRSLLSLTNGGHAFLTDSAGGGVSGFQPFSDGRGVWRCETTGHGEETFSAVILDFTYPTDKYPDPQIARLDIKATYRAGSNQLTGMTTIRFAALDGDPMDEHELKDRIDYGFTGIRITLPN